MGILKKEITMNKIESVQVDFEVNSDVSTPEKTVMEINALKIALAAIFSHIDPDERESIISNIEAIDVQYTQNIVSILKSVHESAK